MLKTLMLLCLLSITAAGQEKVVFTTLPLPQNAVSNDPALPNLSWHRWTTDNFTVHTIDKAQGEYLFNNIEKMKEWTFKRWGLQDVKLDQPVKVFCATDKDTMKKLFNLNGSYAEIRDNKEKILWLVLDGKPAETIPQALTIVCLKAYEQKLQVNLGWWAQRGMAVLNMTLPQVRSVLSSTNASLKKDSEIFLSRAVFKMTEAEWKKLSPEMRTLYDAEAAAMCLMLRKEFGQNAFHDVFVLDQVDKKLGFESPEEMDRTFQRYLTYLTQDIQNGKTPDTYLQIHSKQ